MVGPRYHCINPSSIFSPSEEFGCEKLMIFISKYHDRKKNENLNPKHSSLMVYTARKRVNNTFGG